MIQNQQQHNKLNHKIHKCEEILDILENQKHKNDYQYMEDLKEMLTNNIPHLQNIIHLAEVNERNQMLLQEQGIQSIQEIYNPAAVNQTTMESVISNRPDGNFIKKKKKAHTPVLDKFIRNLEIQKVKANQFIYHYKDKCDFVYIILQGSISVWEKKYDTELTQEMELNTKIQQCKQSYKEAQNEVERNYFDGQIEDFKLKLKFLRNNDDIHILRNAIQEKKFIKQGNQILRQVDPAEVKRTYFLLNHITKFRKSSDKNPGQLIGETSCDPDFKFQEAFVTNEDSILLKIEAQHFNRIFDLQLQKVNFLWEALQNNFPKAKKESLKWLAFQSVEEFYFPEQMIFEEGQKAEHFFIIKTGKVKIFKLQEELPEEQNLKIRTYEHKRDEIAELSNGATFGIENLGGKKIRKYKAISKARPFSLIYLISKKTLDTTIRDFDDLALEDDFKKLLNIKQQWIQDRHNQLNNFNKIQTQESLKRKVTQNPIITGQKPHCLLKDFVKTTVSKQIGFKLNYDHELQEFQNQKNQLIQLNPDKNQSLQEISQLTSVNNLAKKPKSLTKQQTLKHGIEMFKELDYKRPTQKDIIFRRYNSTAQLEYKAMQSSNTSKGFDSFSPRTFQSSNQIDSEQFSPLKQSITPSQNNNKNRKLQSFSSFRNIMNSIIDEEDKNKKKQQQNNNSIEENNQEYDLNISQQNQKKTIKNNFLPKENQKDNIYLEESEQFQNSQILNNQKLQNQENQIEKEEYMEEEEEEEQQNYLKMINNQDNPHFFTSQQQRAAFYLDNNLEIQKIKNTNLKQQFNLNNKQEITEQFSKYEDLINAKESLQQQIQSNVKFFNNANVFPSMMPIGKGFTSPTNIEKITKGRKMGDLKTINPDSFNKNLIFRVKDEQILMPFVKAGQYQDNKFKNIKSQQMTSNADKDYYINKYQQKKEKQLRKQSKQFNTNIQAKQQVLSHRTLNSQNTERILSPNRVNLWESQKNNQNRGFLSVRNSSSPQMNSIRFFQKNSQQQSNNFDKNNSNNVSQIPVNSNNITDTYLNNQSQQNSILQNEKIQNLQQQQQILQKISQQISNKELDQEELQTPIEKKQQKQQSLIENRIQFLKKQQNKHKSVIIQSQKTNNQKQSFSSQQSFQNTTKNQSNNFNNNSISQQNNQKNVSTSFSQINLNSYQNLEQKFIQQDSPLKDKFQKIQNKALTCREKITSKSTHSPVKNRRNLVSPQYNSNKNSTNNSFLQPQIVKNDKNQVQKPNIQILSQTQKVGFHKKNSKSSTYIGFYNASISQNQN